MDHPSKRHKTSPDEITTLPDNTSLASLNKPITPPPRSRQPSQSTAATSTTNTTNTKTIPSPITLTHIRDLPSSSDDNAETIRLSEILGDPLIRECWQFNYLIDVDFLMNQFDADVRSLVDVKVVHGSWKRDAPNRIRIDEACSRWKNVQQVIAYMPEPFGTHHSKMMVLLRHDDLAQVVIHTANMIPGDWANMCQAVWRSPLLPLLQQDEKPDRDGRVGSGARFKRDILTYLRAYGEKKTGSLVRQLERCDFRAVQAALVASVPSKQKLSMLDSEKKTIWGWPALRDIVRRIPVARPDNKPHMITQISSIATLGTTPKWLTEVLFSSLCPSPSPPKAASKPKSSIIFPTPLEIRNSLNGYASGGSIHMKLQSAAQQKQLEYLRPYLCRWTSNSTNINNTESRNNDKEKKKAGRQRSAPHIKTYIRFSDAEKMDRIDWAMISSANLSTQAWGAAGNSNGEVRVSSFEIGVLVWPGLFVQAEVEAGGHGQGDGKGRGVMVPCFRTDVPDPEDGGDADGENEVRIGFRMPYDLPLSPYTAGDMPWCATASYSEPDLYGQTWEG